MPIKHMARSEAEARAVPGARNVRKYEGSDHPGELWIYETHHGLCLHDRERNMHDDSDWFMTVWNPEKGEPEEICFASTRGWTYPCYGSAPDATDEVRKLYAEWQERKRQEYEERKREAERREPRRGKMVRVVRGRKVPRGTEGEVFWRGPGKAFSYAQMRWGVPDRIGFKDAAGNVFWTAVSNVEVVFEEAA